MTDQTTEDQAQAQAEEREVTPEDMISRGKGLKLDAIPEGSPAAAAVEAFKEFAARYQAAEQAYDELKEQRAAEVYKLKEDHNVSFGAMAELLGVTSSMVLYLHERAQGKSAKQIREDSQRSAEAKRRFLESDPNRKSARKQTPEEKAFRKQQREALQAFLKEQGVVTEDGEDAGPEDDDT